MQHFILRFAPLPIFDFLVCDSSYLEKANAA
jgi:hypothetical protein